MEGYGCISWPASLMPGGGTSYHHSDGLEHSAPKAPKACILVVDDEPAVLKVLVTRLE